MSQNPDRPREYDAVLGGQAPPPVDGVVLGGLEGVKSRLNDIYPEQVKISVLSDALKYGQEGRELLQQIVLTETGDVQWLAYDLLFQSATTKEEKQKLLSNFPLQSSVGVDYTHLCNLLAQGNWQEADLETASKMLEAIGHKGRKHHDLDDIKILPRLDLRTIDQLWVKYSEGRFGFSIRKRIWVEEGGGNFYYDGRGGKLYNFNEKAFNKLCERLEWDKQRSLDSAFNLNAPIGSLPRWGGKEILGGMFYHVALLSRSDL